MSHYSRKPRLNFIVRGPGLGEILLKGTRAVAVVALVGSGMYCTVKMSLALKNRPVPIVAETRLPPRLVPIPAPVDTQTDTVITQLRNNPIIEQLDESVRGGFAVTLKSDSLFRIGTAKLEPDALENVQAVITALSSLGSRYTIEIEAHTDDSPVLKNRRTFLTNWELSAARASRLVPFFEEAGFAKNHLRAVGYGDSIPGVPNRDVHGAAIEKNLVKNRRIVLRANPGHTG